MLSRSGACGSPPWQESRWNTARATPGQAYAGPALAEAAQAKRRRIAQIIEANFVADSHRLFVGAQVDDYLQGDCAVAVGKG
jgi:hypothetical protein